MAITLTRDDSSSTKDVSLLGNRFGILFNKLKGDEQAEFVLKDTFSIVERAKQEWESTVDALPELICVISHDGQIIRTNRSVEKWGLGNVKTVRATDFHELIHPDCTGDCYILDCLPKVTNPNRTLFIEKEIYDLALHRFISIRIQPVVAEETDVTNDSNNLVVILNDITDRKETEQTLHRQNNRLITLNAINKAILAADSPQEIAQASLNRIQSLVPYQQAHLLVRLPENDRLQILAAVDDGNVASLKAGQQLSDTTFSIHDSHTFDKFYIIHSLSNLSERNEVEEYWFTHQLHSYMNVPLITGNHNIGALQLAVSDPTIFTPHRIEVIREVAETLTVAIQQSQLHQRLGRTNDELQRILRTKHEIMQDVSHELRSPLALIKGYAEMLKEEFMGPLSDEQKNALNIIDNKGEQLLSLVNRLFKLQTVDKDTLDKVPLNPKSLLDGIVHSWQILTANKHIRLRLESPPKLPLIMADADLLDQVFTNILDNALKFSPEGSSITLRARAADANLIIAISDQGQGIAADKLEHIFNRFYQVKETNQAKAGAGIGLALCKAIVDAHDGRIWAKSDGASKGTTFYICLPIAVKKTDLELNPR